MSSHAARSRRKGCLSKPHSYAACLPDMCVSPHSKNNDRKTTLISENCAVLAVFDGINGHEASEYCKQCMHQNLLRGVNNTW